MPQISEGAVTQALQELNAETLDSFRAAERLYGVSRRTLARRAEGGLSKTFSHQSQQLLAPVQEKWLVEWILDLEQQGYAPSHTEAREMACQISTFNGGPTKVGKNWISRFLHRNPSIRSKIGRKIDALRVRNTNPESLRVWYDMVGKLFQRYRFDVQDIYNMDETGWCLGTQNNQMVLGSNRTKRVYKKSPEAREWVSVIECIYADGTSIQPVTIFKGKSCQSTWFEEEYIPNWLYTTSEKAWTSNEIGLQWLKEVFIPQTVKNPPRPRLLVVDGHESHASVDFMWECRQANIILVYLIPHSSHLCQPLDLSCFSLCKSKYRQEVAELVKWDDGEKVKKINFLRLYESARNEGLTSKAVKLGFKTAGLWPYNPDKVINSSQVLQNQVVPEPTRCTPPPTIPELFSTPSTRIDLQKQIQTLTQVENLSRNVRIILRKTSKAFDQLHVERARDSTELRIRKRQIDQLQSKRRKKVTVDPNQKFVNIEDIKRTHDEIRRNREAYEKRDRQKEAAATSAALLKEDISKFMVEFWVTADPNVDG